MANLSIDLSQREVPAGTYRVCVEMVDVRPSKSGAYPYLYWTLALTEPRYTGSKVFLCTSLSPKALWRLERIFRLLGVYEPGLRVVTDDDTKMLLEPRVVGLHGTATVEEYTWEGKTRTRACGLRNDPDEGWY